MTLGRPGALLAARYRLDRLVGSTGSTERWQAYDERLARPVTARLTLAAEDAAHESAAQAALERLARLNHPGVAAVYDVGTVDDVSTLGTSGAEAGAGAGVVSYAISEWTSGRTLGQIMEAGPQPWPRVADWGRQISGALAALHSLGIVHGALGANSIAIHDDRQVKILDAGLGPVADEAADESEFESARDEDDEDTGDEDEEAGDEAQVEEAPEAEAGAEELVGAADDIYALGRLLWEAVVGAAMDGSADEGGAGDGDGAGDGGERGGHGVESGLVGPLREVDVPAELVELLVEMLSADPARRPAAAVAQQRFGPFAPTERIGDTLPEISLNVATASIATATATSTTAAGTAAIAAANSRTHTVVPTPQVGRTQTGTETSSSGFPRGGPPPGAIATVARLTAERERRRRRGVLVGLALLLAVIGVSVGLLIANLKPSNTAIPPVSDTSVPVVSSSALMLPSASPTPTPSLTSASAVPPSSHAPSASPSPSSASPSPSVSPSLSASPSASDGGSGSPTASGSASATPSDPSRSPSAGPTPSHSLRPRLGG